MAIDAGLFSVGRDDDFAIGQGLSEVSDPTTDFDHTSSNLATRKLGLPLEIAGGRAHQLLVAQGVLDAGKPQPVLPEPAQPCRQFSRNSIARRRKAGSSRRPER